MRPLLLVAGVITALVFSAAATPSLAAQGSGFAGSWKFNPKESDDPQDRLSKAREPVASPTIERSFARGGGGGGDGGGAGRSPRGAPTGGAMGRGAGGRQSCSPLARLQRPAEQVAIEQTDSTLVLIAGECPPLVLYLDGRTTTEPLPEGGVITASHALKGAKLEGQRKYGDETSLNESYVLDEKKGRLVAEFRLNTPQLPRTLRIKLVYDAVPPAGG